MELVSVGLNHRTAPLALRERLAFPEPTLPDTLAHLKNQFADKPQVLSEVAVLSTCNRTELYCATASHGLLVPQLTDWLAKVGGVGAGDLTTHLYRHRADESARHAFRVASGLDSMVLGEPQILGQMKDAARAAQDAGSMGLLLHQLFQRTFKVAKEVRSSTEIGAHSVSMAAATVRLAQRIFGELSGSRVLLVGAGEMIELVAAHIAAQRPRLLTVANRTADRAQKLAERHAADSIALRDLPDQLPNYDIVVSCTAASLPIIGLGMVARAIKARKRRPIMMVDLAVPRDIEPEVAELSDVYLYTVDDLAAVVAEGRDARAASVQQAETIIDTRVREFNDWIAARRALPHLHALKNDTEALRRDELARARKALARGEDIDAVLEQLSRGISNKLLHGPMHLISSGKHDEATVRMLANLHQRSAAESSAADPHAHQRGDHSDSHHS
jgi:glutamyl-tRNA reductase